MSAHCKKIFLIAGEPSGDHIGARLIEKIRDQAPCEVKFIGVGGPKMEAEGLLSKFPMHELCVMGIVEVLPHLPHILRRVRQTVTSIISEDPDILIRTGGDIRVSNFLLWQIAYSELFFLDVFWPDFDMTALLDVIAQFQKRDRRFGGLNS